MPYKEYTVNADNLQIEEIYKYLAEGQKDWKKTELMERVKMISHFSNLLAEQKEFLAKILTEEMGKPITQSRNEIEGVRGRIQFFMENAAHWLSPKNVGSGQEITYDPLGVIANISAWNYPYLVGINVIVPALIAGNAVLYKPSEYTSETGRKIEQLLHTAGIPPNVFTTCIGDGSVGDKLLDLPLDGYFFTGSVATGKHIAKRVAEKLVPVGLELGGKDPVYVTEEIDSIKDVAKACVEGCFYNAGQSCCAVERLYVHQNIYDEFTYHFIEETKRLKVGNPFDENTDIGPLGRAQHVSFLNEQIRDALQQGANLALGGESQDTERGFFSPTVLINTNHSMNLMKDESFGPIIGIQKTTSDNEAIQLMGDTQYGLTAAVYTNNHDRAKMILQTLDVGTAYINCCDRVSPHLPWSGRKNSGLGTTLSYLGILAFVHPKGWHF
jgi:acyl-CoA reductase-like NAD-dependent aldehyde dehydrogenase